MIAVSRKSQTVPMLARRYPIFLPFLLACTFLTGVSSRLQAQDIFQIDQNSFIQTCSGIFTDSGGLSGNNGTTNQQITICSDNATPGLSHIRLSFSLLEVDGVFRVYNGDQVDPTQLILDYDPLLLEFVNPPVVQATASNSTGCLTVVFEPRTSSEAGWSASIDCIRSCQPVRPVLVSSDPAVMPLDTGYIDVCPGETVRFFGGAEFPEDGVIYDQDESTSFFEWNFGDGNRATGTDVEYTFTEGGGYIVQLSVTDIAGCENVIQLNQRVRVAPEPTFNYNPPPDPAVCANTPLGLSGSILAGSSANITATSADASFQFRQEVGDTVYLPDGSGIEHTDTLVFANFAPGATLTSVNDIIGFCMNMEHSYVGDLNISIACPDGKEIALVDNALSPNLGRQWVGLPLDGNDLEIPGVGFDYCFTPDASLTWNAVIATQNIGEDESIPAGDYRPNDPFTDLIGCPLNGAWVITVVDDEIFDNGFLFSWGVSFADYLSRQESFDAPLVSGTFAPNGNYDFFSPDSVGINTSTAGQQSVTYTVTDAFGCESDTTVILDVLPFIDSECYECGAALLDSTAQVVSACGGSNPTASLGSRTSVDTLVQWGAFPSADFSFATHPDAANAFRSSVAVSGMDPGVLLDATTQIGSICVNLETGNTGEVSLFLEGPNGSRLELTTGNGSGPNFTQTCFSPTAGQSITAGTSPFTGSFTPEGSWNILNGEPINGNWTIVAWDEGGAGSPGRVLDWSIEFVFENRLTYSWSPAAGLSCTDCPNPTISATQATTYTLTVTDLFGCSETGTVTFEPSNLDQQLSIDGTMPSCNGLSDATVTVSTTTNDTYTYNWSNGGTGASITGVSAGTYSVSVTQGSCTSELSFEVTDPAELLLSLVGVDSVSCADGSDGRIDISSSGGTGQVSYQWNDPNQQVLEDAVFLSAGAYTVTATDANGCPATLMAAVAQPDPVSISFTTDPVACRGQSTGSATAIPAGGNGSFSFSWETGSPTATADQLAAGAYALTVTDRKGCFAVDSITVTQPSTSISLSAVQDQNGCAGESLNVATANAMGGVPPYQFEWPNGSTSATASGLSAGENTVLVTDDAGCLDSTSIELTDLAPIVFNLIATQPSCNGLADGAMGFNQLSGGAAMNDNEYTYLWSTGSTDIVVNNLPGGVTYELTITDPQGCQGVQTRILEDPPPITLTSDILTVSCFGFSDGGILIGDISGPNPGPYNLQWDANAGSSTSDSIGGLPAGTYNLMVTDVLGCTLSEDFSIKEPERLDATFGRDDVTCFGDFDGSVITSVIGGVPAYAFNWSNGVTESNLENISAGTYDLTVTDANGCELFESITITEPDQVEASATSEAVRCFGDATGRILINATGGREPFTYSLDNTGYSRSDQFIGLPAGDYLVFVRDVGGCIGTTEVTVEDGPEFMVDLGPDSTIIFGDSIRLNPTLSGAVGELQFFYRGSYDGTLLCRGDSVSREESTVVSCQRPSIKPEYEIDYTLLAIDENGCEAEDRIRISVQKIRLMEVPTGFTPNEDGNNDLLRVHGRPGTRITNFRVFDRWGEVVYEAENFPVNDTATGWDGRFRDQLMPAGVYVWQAQILYEDDSEETRSGSVTLIR